MPSRRRCLQWAELNTAMLWYLKDNMTMNDGTATLLTLLRDDVYMLDCQHAVSYLNLQLDGPLKDVYHSTADERQRVKDVLNSYAIEESLETIR